MNYKTANRIVVALAVAMLGSCGNDSVDPNINQGSTLPVPDMTLVDFTHDGLTSNIVAVGQDGAMWPGGEVSFSNNTNGLTDTGVASDSGSFLVPLTNAEDGDDVEVGTGEGGAAAPTDWPFETEQDSPIPLDLTPRDGGPPAPAEANAVANGDAGTAAVFATFLGIGLEAELSARVHNLETGNVQTFPTQILEDARTLESVMENTVIGDELVIYGVFPAGADTPELLGDSVRVTVAGP